jgi:cytochrome c oxidase subunit 2
VDTRIRFAVTALEQDFVHSFWIPGFRLKIDAVPGRSTELLITPEKTGSYEDDPTLRVQCAELCGIGHADMKMGVRVVERSEFDRYITSLKEG